MSGIFVGQNLRKTMDYKGRFTIYLSVDASHRKDIAGIELKSILMYICVISPAELRVTYNYYEPALSQ